MIVIVGAGMVGLVLATALARENFPVTVVETRLPELSWPENALDSRVSALNVVSQRILANLDIWRQLPLRAFTPMRGLKVWDALGNGEIQFDSAQIGEAQLGFIVENRALIKTLWENLAHLPAATILCPHHLSTLDDDLLRSAQLIIGADGGNSWVREQMGINTQERSYEQQALTAVIKIEHEHESTGWQSFLPTGPLGVLPLADPHTVAIVWSNTLPAAQQLMALGAADFNQQLTVALNHRLGEMVRLTEPKLIPLVMRHADEYVQSRLALIGDAAHTIHPLAGQGANLGLLDAAALTEVLLTARQKQQDIGSLRVLRRYQRWRKGDNALMLAAMRGFKELFSGDSPWLVQLRSHGLSLTNQTDFIKNSIMRYAIGRQGDLPTLAHTAPRV